MLDEVQTRVESSITPLMKDILSDVQLLLRQEFALAKSELRVEAMKVRNAGMLLTCGMLTGLCAVLLVCISFALGISAVFTTIPLWGSFAIAAAILCVVTAVLVLGGFSLFRSLRWGPRDVVAH